MAVGGNPSFIGDRTQFGKLGDVAGGIIDSTKKVAKEIGKTQTYDVARHITLETLPSFYKISILVLFYIFFYRIFFDMGVFFGVDQVPLVLYMVWFGILFLFLAFIPMRRTKLEKY